MAVNSLLSISISTTSSNSFQSVEIIRNLIETHTHTHTILWIGELILEDLAKFTQEAEGTYLNNVLTSPTV